MLTSEQLRGHTGNRSLCIDILLFTDLHSCWNILLSHDTIIYVKKNTIANTNVVKSVTKIIVTWTVFVIASQSLPITAFIIRSHSNGSVLVYSVAWLFIYSVEISYPSFLLLVLFLHKTVRETFIGKCKKIGT